MNIEGEFLKAYDQYAKPIYRHIYFKVSDQETACDLTQDVFFKAWQYITVSDKEITNFKAFLYKTASNLVIDHYRQKAKEPVSLNEQNMPEPAAGESQEKEVERNISIALAKKILSDLEGEVADILYYHYVDDLNIKEISDIIGKSQNNIRVIIHRALKELKEKYV